MTLNSSYDPLSYSFKKKIISRIVASVQYYLKINDLNRAESGLITLLNVVGFLSSEIIEVLVISAKESFLNFRSFLHT